MTSRRISINTTNTTTSISLPNPFAGAPNIGVKPSQPVQASSKKKKKKNGVKCGNNGTHIVVILDESGSMCSCWEPTIDGFNEFQKGQRETTNQDEKTWMTVVKFDGGSVNDLYTHVDINEAPTLNKENYTPRGSTNLLDAIGQTIERVDDSLGSKKKKDRPSVLFVIFTDGEENASRSFNNETIKEMVGKREKKDWTFMFLGANIDAFSAGSAWGMGANNTMQYSTSNMGATMAAVSSATTRYRGLRSKGLSNDQIMAESLYTDAERFSALNGDTEVK